MDVQNSQRILIAFVKERLGVFATVKGRENLLMKGPEQSKSFLIDRSFTKIVVLVFAMLTLTVGLPGVAGAFGTAAQNPSINWDATSRIILNNNTAPADFPDLASEVSGCVGCHTFDRNINLSVVPNVTELENSETSITLSGVGPDNHDFWYKYSVEDGTPSSTSSGNATVSIGEAPAAGDSTAIEYCIASRPKETEEGHDNVRNYNCGVLNVTRSEQPVVVGPVIVTEPVVTDPIVVVIPRPEVELPPIPPIFEDLPEPITFDLFDDSDPATVSFNVRYFSDTAPDFDIDFGDDTIISVEPALQTADFIQGLDRNPFTITPVGTGTTAIGLTILDEVSGVEVNAELTVTVLDNTPSSPVEINSLSVASPLSINLGDSTPVLVSASGGSSALTYTAEVSVDDIGDVGVSPTSNSDGNFIITGESDTDSAQVTFSVSDGVGSPDSRTLEVVVIDSGDGNGSPTGMSLYTSLNCSSCHSGGFPGAPVIGDTARWQELVNLRTQSGLLESVITGRGNMTPYPLPNPDYNEADLRAAVEFVSGGVVADQDLDGIPDTADNCRDDVNPGQEDGDNDGIGNECDTTDGAGNNPPVAQPDEHIITAADGSELINVLGNDTDPDEGDTLSIVLDNATSRLGVTLLIEDNQVRYQAPDGFSQTDMFSYRAKDSSDEESDSVTVMVSPSDQDDDGIFDNADNCPGVPNSDQNNQDSDDLGDACDATPGGGSASTVLSEEALARAQALFEELCAGCHLNAANPAPQLGDQTDWDNRLEMAGSIEALVDVAINGNQLGMPRFGDLRTAEELTEAVVYLGGFATTDTGEEVGTGTDPNIGETNPTADNDADGYIASVDDDDTNAERIPGTAPIGSGNPVFFISDSSMMVGEVGRAVLSANDNQSGGVLISDTDFVQFAQQVYPGVQASVEDRYISALDTIDLQLNLASGSTGELTMELANPLQLSSVISTYSPQNGTWSDFVTDAGVGELASAPLGQGGCPVVGSLNYIGGLGAGLQCVRVRITDGGMNDADRQVNGQILFIAQLSSIVDDSTGTNPTPVTSGGSSGGGGMTSVWLLLFLGIGKCIRCHRLLTRRRIFQRCLKGFSSA